MPDTANWLKDYVPLGAALAAVTVALFQYFTSRPKMRLEMEKLRREIDRLSETSKTNSDQISEIQKVIVEQLPLFPDETVVYSNPAGSMGHDFQGNGGHIYKGDTPITKKGEGALSFLDKGIINIDRVNTDGRYELYLRSYAVGAKKTEVIPKDTTEEKVKRFRVTCEARAINGEHTVKFVMRDREKRKWLGRGVAHRIVSPEWTRIEGYFTVPPFVEAELRVDDEDVSVAPSTLQIRRLMMTQRMSE